MPSAASLFRRLDELKGSVAHEKRAVRHHRARLHEAKGELTDVIETLEQLGFEVEIQAKRISHGRRKHS